MRRRMRLAGLLAAIALAAGMTLERDTKFANGLEVILDGLALRLT